MVKGLAVGHGSLFANVTRQPLDGGLRAEHIVSDDIGLTEFEFMKSATDIVTIVATQRSTAEATQVVAVMTREVLEEALKTLDIA